MSDHSPLPIPPRPESPGLFDILKKEFTEIIDDLTQSREVKKTSKPATPPPSPVRPKSTTLAKRAIKQEAIHPKSNHTLDFEIETLITFFENQIDERIIAEERERKDLLDGFNIIENEKTVHITNSDIQAFELLEPPRITETGDKLSIEVETLTEVAKEIQKKDETLIDLNFWTEIIRDIGDKAGKRNINWQKAVGYLMRLEAIDISYFQLNRSTIDKSKENHILKQRKDFERHKNSDQYVSTSGPIMSAPETHKDQVHNLFLHVLKYGYITGSSELKTQTFKLLHETHKKDIQFDEVKSSIDISLYEAELGKDLQTPLIKHLIQNSNNGFLTAALLTLLTKENLEADFFLYRYLDSQKEHTDTSIEQPIFINKHLIPCAQEILTWISRKREFDEAITDHSKSPQDIKVLVESWLLDEKKAVLKKPYTYWHAKLGKYLKSREIKQLIEDHFGKIEHRYDKETIRLLTLNPKMILELMEGPFTKTTLVSKKEYIKFLEHASFIHLHSIKIKPNVYDENTFKAITRSILKDRKDCLFFMDKIEGEKEEVDQTATKQFYVHLITEGCEAEILEFSIYDRAYHFLKELPLEAPALRSLKQKLVLLALKKNEWKIAKRLAFHDVLLEERLDHEAFELV